MHVLDAKFFYTTNVEINLLRSQNAHRELTLAVPERKRGIICTIIIYAGDSFWVRVKSINIHMPPQSSRSLLPTIGPSSCFPKWCSEQQNNADISYMLIT